MDIGIMIFVVGDKRHDTKTKANIILLTLKVLNF